MKLATTSLLIAAGLAAPVLLACRADDAPFGKVDGTWIAPSAPSQAYSLARVQDGDGEIEAFAVSDNYVFFIAFWQGVYRVPKYGGEVERIEESRKANVLNLAANHDQVFWQRFTGSDEQAHFDMHMRAAAGGPRRELTNVSALSFDDHYPGTLRADADHVYMVSDDSVVVVPVDGSALVRVAAPEPESSDQRSSDANWVPDYPALFMTSCFNSDVDCPLLRSDLTTGAIASVARVPPGSAVLAADEAFVYVEDDKRIWRFAKSDFSSTQIYQVEATDEYLTSELQVDAENVYFMSYASSSFQLRAVPKVGGSARLIGAGPQLGGGSWGLGQDDAFIFVLSGPIREADGNWRGNEILAFPKTPIGVTQSQTLE